MIAAAGPQRHAAAIAARANACALRLSLLWAAVFFPVGLHLPYFPVWLASRGVSPDGIAAVLAIPPVLRIVVTPAVASVADRRGIAGVLAVCACIVLAGYGVLAATHAGLAVAIVAILLIVAQGSMPPLADALTLAEIRRFTRLGSRRIEYGHMRVCASASVLVMMVCSGPLIGALPAEGIVDVLVAMAVLPALAGLVIARGTRRLRAPRDAVARLVADPAQLAVALVVIAAAALTQASHAEIYAFGTLGWRSAGLSPLVIGIAWALGVASESVVFLTAGRYVTTPRRAALFLAVGAAGGALRWAAMASAPPAALTLMLQLLHGASFAATYLGSVLLLGHLASETHRARMQGWLAGTSSFLLAAATMAAGQLAPRFGAHAYFAMAALAGAGLSLALVAVRLLPRSLTPRAPAPAG